MENDYIASIRPYLKELQPLDIIPTNAQAKLGKAQVKAVIFDIYGTLIMSASGDVDQADYHSGMIKKALMAAHYTILEDSHEVYDSIYADYGTYLKKHKTIGKDAGRAYPEVDILEVWQYVLSHAEMKGNIKINPGSDLKLFTFIFELETNHVWPMPGLKTLIDKLKESKYELGIISNAQFYTPVIMNHFLYDLEQDGEVIEPFEKDLTIYSYKELRGKPDIALFEKLIPHLTQRGIRPDEALFVGNDMLKDIYTAHEAGLRTVLFGGDQRSYRLRSDDERCKTLQPDFVITELSQLSNILNL